MLYRCIAPEWLQGKPKVLEGTYTDEQVKDINGQGYNIYYLPNYPSIVPSDSPVDGADIDVFTSVFVDMDLKSGTYATCEAFLERVGQAHITPTKIVYSGNGVHVYWNVSDLNAQSFLRLQRRLMRLFNTDPAICKIFQLMRAPGTLNTKDKNNFKPCEIEYELDKVYTSEELDKLLPPITLEDEEYCRRQYNSTNKINEVSLIVDDKLPLKFSKLLSENKEVKEIWKGNVADRSAGDYRLGHIMLADGFTKEEAMSVLVNAAKALERLPAHRISYAQGIVDKVWAFEKTVDKTSLNLSSTVRDILQKGGDEIKGTRFPCHDYVDATEHGFRLTQVIGLVAGSGVGKTAMALDMFYGFVKKNPEYDHFFVPLEQPTNEIAERWKILCGPATELHDKVHIISNYDEHGGLRHLSFTEIKDYILKFKMITGKKVGAVVIDHIGALKRSGKGETQDLMTICQEMKGFAMETNTMLIMQSQAPREKAGAGDLELGKDAAYGTMYFESFCDYLVTIWQPLKQVYGEEGCPTVTAFKFCKIRHKKVGKDSIQEDTSYRLFFEPETNHFRTLTQAEETSFTFFNNKAINRRKADRKTDVVPYKSTGWVKEGSDNGNSDTSQNAGPIKSTA